MPGIDYRVEDEDIVYLDSNTGQYTMVLDGSDVGFSTTAHDIKAFFVMDDGSILLSFVDSTYIPDVGSVQDQDIVKFTPSSLGDNSAGSFSMYFDGEDVGMTAGGENISALHVLDSGDILFSVTGNFNAGGVSGADEDIFLFSPTSLGDDTDGSFSFYFDGSDVGLGESGYEDVHALWVDEGDSPPQLYLSTRRNFSVPGLSGEGCDVFIFDPDQLGTTTQGTFLSPLYLDGSNFDLSNELVDSIHVMEEAPATLSEYFEWYAVGEDPVSWLDQRESLEEVDLFDVKSVDSTMALGTSSTETNIYSHYVGGWAGFWQNYEFTGRMRFTSTGGGMGVTFYSQYPSADEYYRLRAYSGGSVHISPHPDGKLMSGGATDTGISMAADTWYRFRIQVETTYGGTRVDIRAKIWIEGAGEPASWQVDCWDDSASRYTSGTIGVWTMSSGTKYFDDLEVSPLY